MISKECLDKLYNNISCEFCEHKLDCNPEETVKQHKVSLCQEWHNVVNKDLNRLEQKETAMKVKDKSFFDSHQMTVIGHCPNSKCKGKDLYKDYHLWNYMNYCPVCGQKLDWSEDNES